MKVSINTDFIEIQDAETGKRIIEPIGVNYIINLSTAEIDSPKYAKAIKLLERMIIEFEKASGGK